MPKIKQSALKHAAKSNVTIKRNDEVVKEGTPLDHSAKHGIPNVSPRVVGMNKGITRNMGDYESLRVDVWLSDEIQDGETAQDAFNRVEEIVDEVLEEAVLSMVDD